MLIILFPYLKKGSVDQDLVVQPKIIDNYQPKCGRHRPEGFGVNVAQGTRSVGLRQSRIPDQAQFAEWPAMCALFRLDLLTSQNIFIGGASLLTPGVALTAAHLLKYYEKIKSPIFAVALK